MDMGLGYAEPYITGYKTWFGSDEPVRLPVSKPYEGWISPASAAKLKICGVDLPDGIVMTHCQVGSAVSYSPTPLQEEIRRKSRIEARTYTDKDGKKIGTLFSIKSEKGPGDGNFVTIWEVVRSAYSGGHTSHLCQRRYGLRRSNLPACEMRPDLTREVIDQRDSGCRERQHIERMAREPCAPRIHRRQRVSVQDAVNVGRRNLRRRHRSLQRIDSPALFMAGTHPDEFSIELSHAVAVGATDLDRRRLDHRQR